MYFKSDVPFLSFSFFSFKTDAMRFMLHANPFLNMSEVNTYSLTCSQQSQHKLYYRLQK